MKNIIILVSILIGTSIIIGCGSKDEASTAATSSTPSATPVSTTVAYDIGTKKKGDKGVCVMCNAKEGTTAEEEIVETLDYQGKTYIFCNSSEKAEFIADPAKYLKK